MGFVRSIWLLAVCLFALSTPAIAQSGMESPGMSAVERAVADRVSKLRGEVEELMGQLSPPVQSQLRQVLAQPPGASVPRGPMSAVERALVDRILKLKGEIEELMGQLSPPVQSQFRQKLSQAPGLEPGMVAMPGPGLVFMMRPEDAEKIEGMLMRAQLNELRRLGQAISQLVARGEGLDAKTQQRWKDFLERISGSGVSADADALARYALQESFSETVGGLEFQTLKVKFYNNLKARIGEEIARARKIAGAAAGLEGDAPLPKSIRKKRFLSAPSPDGKVMVQEGAAVSTVGEMKAYIEGLETQLQMAGEDAVQANKELEKGVQQQQQTLQTMSGVSKMLQETAAPVMQKP